MPLAEVLVLLDLVRRVFSNSVQRALEGLGVVHLTASRRNEDLLKGRHRCSCGLADIGGIRVRRQIAPSNKLLADLGRHLFNLLLTG